MPPRPPARATEAASPHVTIGAWAIALLAGVAPLWLVRDLPLQDLPQHLYVLAALRHLHDPSTLFPKFFEPRPGLTPYVGYYFLVDALARVMPLELANRIFLTLCVAALPLAVALLLKGLNRPTWPALLTLVLAYGDNFGFGFINYCAALPLAFVAMGCFLLALTRAGQRARWSVLLALSMVATLAFHPVPLALLALALPYLLLTTSAPEDESAGSFGPRLFARLPAIAGTLPAIVIAYAWFQAMRAPALHEIGTVDLGWGSHWTIQRQGFGQNLHDLPLLLADLFQDGSDRWALRVAAALALLDALVWVLSGRLLRFEEEWLERTRPLGLVLIALVLYFALPFNIQPVMQWLNPRLALPTGALALAAVPRLGGKWLRAFLALATACAVLLGVTIGAGFQAFDREAWTLRALLPVTGPQPVIMGLIYDPHSRVVQQSVYLHSAAVLARLKGGLPDYTLGAWRQSPIRYRAEPPPQLISNWRPDLFDYAKVGVAYDHFLVRGADPAAIFGARLGRELYVAGHSGEFWLIRRVR
jgi:hypothetical protein